MSEIKPEAIAEIVEMFRNQGIALTEQAVEDRLDKLVTKFKVPFDEAKRTVINYFLKEHGLKQSQFYAASQDPKIQKIADVKEDNTWFNVKARVAQLWENSHESIAQVGLLGDETGTVKFMAWASANAPQVEEGKSYLFRSVVAKAWNGKMELNLNKKSTIEPLDEDIEISNLVIEVAGAVVDIQQGSSLIKRCPTCNRAMAKGLCTEHGRVEGKYDLRLKLVLDNGKVSQDVLLNRELTEQITETSLDTAIAMAAEALDQGIVIEAMTKLLIGRYYSVTGTHVDRYLLAESAEKLYEVTADQLAALIAATKEVA